MARVSVLLDANILYPASLRSVFIQLSIEGLFHVRWTDDIHREWIENLLENEPRRERAKLERTRRLMDAAIEDCLVTDYADLIPTLNLPDPDDDHVLAAAIVGRCQAIITKDLGHFPATMFKEYGLEAVHPDQFLSRQLDAHPFKFCQALREILNQCKNPPYTIDEYLNILTQHGLKNTVAALDTYRAFI